MSQVERHSLGEEKTTACVTCGTHFLKKRRDHKFCSPMCLSRYKYVNTVSWKDRPDREAQNKARNERYHANRETELAKQRAWRESHKEEYNAQQREEYQRNKKKHFERAKAYRALHPEIAQKSYRNARNKRPWEKPLTNARHRALKKHLAFDLTREWCEQKWTGLCAVTNLPFSFGTSLHYPFAPSIDRIDATIGYTQSNCRFVLFAVNSFKGVGTDQQMLEIAKAIVSHQNAFPFSP